MARCAGQGRAEQRRARQVRLLSAGRLGGQPVGPDPACTSCSPSTKTPVKLATQRNRADLRVGKSTLRTMGWGRTVSSTTAPTSTRLRMVDLKYLGAGAQCKRCPAYCAKPSPATAASCQFYRSLWYSGLLCAGKPGAGGRGLYPPPHACTHARTHAHHPTPPPLTRRQPSCVRRLRLPGRQRGVSRTAAPCRATPRREGRFSPGPGIALCLPSHTHARTPLAPLEEEKEERKKRH